MCGIASSNSLFLNTNGHTNQYMDICDMLGTSFSPLSSVWICCSSIPIPYRWIYGAVTKLHRMPMQ